MNKECINDYYKIVLRERFSIYEKTIALLDFLSLATFEGKKKPKPYHRCFVSVEEFLNFATEYLYSTSDKVWLSDDLLSVRRELNDIITECDYINDTKRIMYGKENYEKINELCGDIQTLLIRDLLRLHDVEGFLKEKQARW